MSFVKLAIFAAVIANGAPDVPDDVSAPPVYERGAATWYGNGNLHGSVMANTEPFKPNEDMICAHKTIPLGTYVLVERPSTGKKIWCWVNDRGPYMVRTTDGKRKAEGPWYTPKKGEEWHGILDLSTRAAKELGTYKQGVVNLTVRTHITKRRRYGAAKYWE